MSLLLKSIETSTQDLTFELLGILANLTIPDFDYHKLVTSYNLLDVLAKVMQQSLSQSSESKDSGGLDESDDVLLECIMTLGTLAEDESIAPLIVASPILELLVECMIVKDEDDEMILQLCFTIYQFLSHEETCHVLIKIPRTLF